MSHSACWDQHPPADVSQHHWQTLLAIADGFTGDAQAPAHSLASQCQPFVDLLRDVIENRLPPNAIKEIKLFMVLVGGYTGYAFNGTSQYLYDLPRGEVENIILGWQRSRLAPIRTGAKGLGYILRYIWLRTCPGLIEAMGHPGHVVPNTTSSEQSSLKDVLADAIDGTYDDLPIKQISTGVLVIGSGSGASSFVGSFLRNIKEHNWRSILQFPDGNLGPRVSDILIVEKGSTFLPHASGTSLPPDDHASFTQLMDNSGVMASDESGISVLAGSTWGGGSRINWSACLQTDRIVREEWTRHMLSEVGKGGKDPHGRMFLSGEWQDCMEEVEKHLGVQVPREEDHNAANKMLWDGAKKMGYTIKAVPQNISGSFADHARCGASCTVGCRGHLSVEEKKGKMSGSRAFLHPATTASKDEPDVKGLDGFEVEKIVFDSSDSNRAIGAVGKRVKNGKEVRVLIRAKMTVVSAGTLHTPAILLRSGLKNPQIGANLHLHPVLIVQSTWLRRINSWEGTILTTVINEFANLDGQGHGVKLEAMCMLPSLCMSFTPWRGSSDWNDRVREYPRTMQHIVLCREKNTGRVYVDQTGKMRFNYLTGAEERKWILEGFVGLAKLLHTMGAEEIFTNTAGMPIWKRSSSGRSWAERSWTEDQAFLDFLEAYTKMGLDIDRTSFGSAHQMGTCRMSGTAKTGVVDARGKVWGKEGLYLADASVFPSASGVNPMITTMAFGEWIGRRIVEEIAGEGGDAAAEVPRARL